MKKNPLKGLSFHAAEVNTDFLLGAGTFSLFSLFSICLRLSRGDSSSLWNSVFSVYLSLSPLGYFCFSPLFSHTVPLLRGINTSPEWKIYYGRGGGWKYQPDNQFASRLCPESQFISIVDFIFYLQVCSSAHACLNQCFTFLLSHLSVHLNNSVQCLKCNIDTRRVKHVEDALLKCKHHDCQNSFCCMWKEMKKQAHRHMKICSCNAERQRRLPTFYSTSLSETR